MASECSKTFQKWPFFLILPSLSDFVLIILKLANSNSNFFWSFGHRTNQISQENYCLTQFGPRRWGLLVRTWPIIHNPIWLNQNKEPPPHCLIFCQISILLTSLDYSMSKWPEKIKIWYSNSHIASESSKQYLICQLTSLKEAISENGFDYYEN